MAKYPEKMRKHPKRSRLELNEHVSGNGKVKKRLRPQHAKDIAERTGMNAYHCGVCGAWHVGRNPDQLAEDSWKTGRRR